jgi:sulfonate transport system substrate-binding protein
LNISDVVIGMPQLCRASGGCQNFGEQQKIADTFYRAGLLPAPVDTGSAQRWNFSPKRAEAALTSTTASGG